MGIFGQGSPKKRHQRTLDRIELAVRLEFMNLGFTDTQIAEHLKMTTLSLKRIKGTKEYKRVHTEYLSGVCANLDTKINETYDEGRKILESGVPIALRNLVLNASQKIDKKLQMEATKELLDRHGMFSKVSRVGLPTKAQDEGINAKDNEVANALVAALSNGTIGASAPCPNNGVITDTSNTVITPTISTEPVTDKVQ